MFFFLPRLEYLVLISTSHSTELLLKQRERVGGEADRSSKYWLLRLLLRFEGCCSCSGESPEGNSLPQSVKRKHLLQVLHSSIASSKFSFNLISDLTCDQSRFIRLCCCCCCIQLPGLSPHESMIANQ